MGPERLLPESLDDLDTGELGERAAATARLLNHSHYDLGRALNRLRELGCLRLGYASVLDFAEAELGIGRREAYQLMRVDRLTEALPAVRTAYAAGAIAYSKARVLAEVATAEDEHEWVELARVKSCRELSALSRRRAHERAEKGEAAWPETGLYGELGRPDPPRPRPRPYSKALLELEADTWELHNRFAGCDTSWGEFYEAALVSYQQELQTARACLPGHVRETLERDNWRCRVPNCTSRSELQCHHVVRRSQGGDDDPERLVALCAPHHQALHEGLLRIEGSASIGFRFAHRASVFDEWIRWAARESEPAAPDPHAVAWDLEDSKPVQSPRREAWVASGSRTSASWPEGSSLRDRSPRYGGRLPAAVARRFPSAHVCTRVHSPDGPVAGRPQVVMRT